MKKVYALALAILMLLVLCTYAMADAQGSASDWTAYDQLISQIKTTTDSSARVDWMHQAEDMLMETGAVCPLYFINSYYMAKSLIKGLHTDHYGMSYFMYATNGNSDVIQSCLMYEPDNLDPAMVFSAASQTLAANSFAGLYANSASGNPVPNLATGCDVSNDGLTYTFHLRDNLKWSDGSPLDANDFVYGWKRAAAPESNSDYGFLFRNIAGFPDALQVSASANGKDFIVVTQAPCVYLLSLTTFPIFYPIQQACVEAAPNYNTNPSAWATDAGFVSNGAFTIQEWNHGQSIVFMKNPYYWDAGNVKIDRLVFTFINDDTAIYSAYQNGSLDCIFNVPSSLISSLMNDPEFHIFGRLGTNTLCFNINSSLFDGKTIEQASAIRKAISLLIDRQHIINTVSPIDRIATSYIPLGILDGNGGIFKDAAAHDYPNGSDGYYGESVDVDGAIELLKSAGYKFNDSGKLISSTPIVFDYLTSSTPSYIATAECIKADLAVIGVHMDINIAVGQDFIKERSAGNYDSIRFGWLADYNDPINMLEVWTSDSNYNYCHLGSQPTTTPTPTPAPTPTPQPDLTGKPGDTLNISIPFSYTEPFKVLQLSYSLSPGLTFVGATCSNMSGTVSSTKAVFVTLTGVTDGTVILQVKINDDTTTNQSVNVTEIIGTNQETTFPVGTAKNYLIGIDLSVPDPGDANDDGAVDIMDLVNIIDYIVSGTEPGSMTGADANGDGSVDIMDLVFIINLIVNPPVNSGAPVGMPEDTARGNTVSVEVPFYSSTPITALELAYSLSPGLTFVNAECSGMVGAGGETNAVFANVNGGVTNGMVTLEVALNASVTADQSVTVTAVTGANTAGTRAVGSPQTYIIDVNASALSILTQPVDATVSVGNTATFTVEAAGPEPLTYQWYVNTNTGVGWLAVAGATGNTYTTGPAVIGDDGFRYFCRVIAGESYLDTEIATLTVVASPRTGDNSNVLWLIFIALLAAYGIGALLFYTGGLSKPQKVKGR